MYVWTIIVEEKETGIFGFSVRKDLSESRKFNDIEYDILTSYLVNQTKVVTPKWSH